MEEIKVGEYIRTKNKGICKIDHINEKATVNKYWVNPDYDGWCTSVKTTEIVKHSKNIIDLIEYGDLIKFKTVKVTDMRDGKEREFNFVDAKFCDGWTDNKIIYDMDYLIDKDQTSQIEWVLTREQILANCYKV